jgi:2-polyprenyl-6-methoxyphenol hydroxylase-like FAD-dependent oxidoreductase
MIGSVFLLPAGPHAVIAGASVAGLASACALAQQGWSVTVLERRRDLLEGGRAFLLQPNGLAALERLGALGPVRERALVVSRVLFYVRGQKPAAIYDYGELRHPHAYALEIRPRALRAALAERAAQLGVQQPRFGCELVDVVRGGGVVTGARWREDGKTVELTGDVLVGADGPGSRTRAALGIASRRFSHTDTYLLGTVDVSRDTRDVVVYCGAGYGNGVCPLLDGTYFWDRLTDANRPAVAARDLMGWRATYERRVPCASEFLDALDTWEQLIRVEVRPFWAAVRTAPGAALVGDAAGAVHPHSAQGANLALEDAAALGDALASHIRSGAVAREPLSAYARARHAKLRRYVLWSLLAAGSIDGPSRFWRAARSGGFRCNRIGPMRRELLKRQAGLA